jgi:hypothetical protein
LIEEERRVQVLLAPIMSTRLSRALKWRMRRERIFHKMKLRRP